jgi:hypothetical protein
LLRWLARVCDIAPPRVQKDMRAALVVMPSLPVGPFALADLRPAIVLCPLAAYPG